MSPASLSSTARASRVAQVLLAVSASLASLVLLPHCKSSVDTGAGESTGDFVTQYCALVAPCCSAKMLGSAGCTADNPALQAVLPQGVLHSDLTFAPQDLDPAAAKACLDAVKASSGSAAFCTGDFWLQNHVECQAARLVKKSGTVPVGGACNDAVSGSECARSPDGQTGCVFGEGGKQICQVQVLGAMGDACDADSAADGSISRGVSNDVAPTNRGVYCDRSQGLHCAGGTCKAATAVGKPCTDAFECVVGAYCDQFDQGTQPATHQCVSQRPGGAACTQTTQCLAHDGCDFPTKTCPAAVSAGKGPADPGVLCVR